jgi:hypothetical protein
MIRIALGMLASVLFALVVSAQAHQTDQQVAARIVHESRAAYYATGLPCACPEDHMRNGRLCGRVSAYIRPGGASPKCYVTDVTAGEILDWRARHK